MTTRVNEVIQGQQSCIYKWAADGDWSALDYMPPTMILWNNPQTFLEPQWQTTARISPPLTRGNNERCKATDQRREINGHVRYGLGPDMKPKNLQKQVNTRNVDFLFRCLLTTINYILNSEPGTN